MANAKNMSLDNKPVNIFFFGAPKTGKTSIIRTFPGLPYVFDFDDGLWPLMGHDVEYDTFTDVDSKRPEALVKAKKKLDEFSKMAREKGHVEINGRRIDMVVLDGCSEFLQSAMNYVLMTAGRPGGVPQQNDWSPQMTEFMRFITQMKALPCHTMVIAHEDAREDKITGEIKMLPAITGKLSGRIAGKYDVVFRAEIQKRGGQLEHRLLTRHKGLVEAGHRFNDAFEMYEAMDLKVIMDKIRTYSSAHQPVGEMSTNQPKEK